MPKPNARFLSSLVRQVDSHNYDLILRENKKSRDLLDEIELNSSSHNNGSPSRHYRHQQQLSRHHIQSSRLKSPSDHRHYDTGEKSEYDNHINSNYNDDADRYRIGRDFDINRTQIHCQSSYSPRRGNIEHIPNKNNDCHPKCHSPQHKTSAHSSAVRTSTSPQQQNQTTVFPTASLSNNDSEKNSDDDWNANEKSQHRQPLTLPSSSTSHTIKRTAVAVRGRGAVMAPTPAANNNSNSSLSRLDKYFADASYDATLDMDNYDDTNLDIYVGAVMSAAEERRVEARYRRREEKVERQRLRKEKKEKRENKKDIKKKKKEKSKKEEDEEDEKKKKDKKYKHESTEEKHRKKRRRRQEDNQDGSDDERDNNSSHEYDGIGSDSG
ncbi:hypothetical protein HK100_000289 [Physocladia obscura]|uniref:Uncharacterized protein n=1 Tax=Physocladia obscura TaxID=109957 RepID=A0AAD5XFQ1_9FUNG|nr:hypothetical protein HK100_000289 [Physocladia obscura]